MLIEQDCQTEIAGYKISLKMLLKIHFTPNTMLKKCTFYFKGSNQVSDV